MAKFVDLIGKTFGRLKVLYKCDYKKNNKIVYFGNVINNGKY